MSSTDIKIFEKEEFGSVRVVMQGDDPWFVASDVAKSLGYDNPANAINTHCKKINKITLSPDLGGREISSKMPPVVMNIIPESDVYRLVMRSNLPNAVAFQDWVCEEVLPAIRKTGEYSTTLPDFTNPAEAARAWADEYEKNLALTAANQQLTEEKEMLEIVIGNAREWKAVTAIPWLKHYFIDTSPRTCAAIELVMLFHHDPQTNAEHDVMKMQIITSDIKITKLFSLIVGLLLLPGCGRYDGAHVYREPQFGEGGGVEDHTAHVGCRQRLEPSCQGHDLNGASDAFLGEFLLHHLG